MVPNIAIMLQLQHTLGDNTISEPSATVCATPEEWNPAAPSNLMSFPGDEEMLLIRQGPGDVEVVAAPKEIKLRILYCYRSAFLCRRYYSWF